MIIEKIGLVRPSVDSKGQVVRLRTNHTESLLTNIAVLLTDTGGLVLVQSNGDPIIVQKAMPITKLPIQLI